VIGIAGDPVGPEAENDLRPMHPDRLHDPRDQLVHVDSIQLPLREVEHAHHAHAEERHRSAQLVLSHGVEVPPGDGRILDVAVLTAGERR
jgi:hypothetical protein